MMGPMNQADDIGLWCEVTRGNFGGRPAVFLDRDGVIVEDTRYLGHADRVQILPGAAEAIARCNQLAIPVVMVTNQSGIARGYYDWEGFSAVQRAIASMLERRDAHLDAVFACAYHAEGHPPLAVADHPWRKPNPGMLFAAGKQLDVGLSRSWIIGDRTSDLGAGRAAGLAGGVLISANDGDPERQSARTLGDVSFTIEILASLAEAIANLISRGALRA